MSVNLVFFLPAPFAHLETAGTSVLSEKQHHGVGGDPYSTGRMQFSNPLMQILTPSPLLNLASAKRERMRSVALCQ